MTRQQSKRMKRVFGYVLRAVCGLAIVLPPSVVHAASASAADPQRGNDSSVVRGPSTAEAGAESSIGPRVFDIDLAPGGVFSGTTIDPQGTPLAGTVVFVVRENKEVARAITDDAGKFSIRGLAPGTYVVIAEGGASAVRIWKPGTAPPSATQHVMVVTGSDVVRGHYGPFGGIPPLKFWLTDPLFMGMVVVAAVAIPVAIHNRNRDEDGPTSP